MSRDRLVCCGWKVKIICQTGEGAATHKVPLAGESEPCFGGCHCALDGTPHSLDSGTKDTGKLLLLWFGNGSPPPLYSITPLQSYYQEIRNSENEVKPIPEMHYTSSLREDTMDKTKERSGLNLIESEN